MKDANEIVDHLDKLKLDWRFSHVLMMDNMSSHKTQQTISILQYLQVPICYTAPASFKALPIEGVFAALKGVDFRQREIPEQVMRRDSESSTMTHKQKLLSQVAHYIISLSDRNMNSIYRERLLLLSVFLEKKKE